MFKKSNLFLVVLIFVFTGVVSTFALAEDDVEGSQDHPMISRFEGSVIEGYEQFNYDRQEFVTGLEEGEVEEAAFEGKTTRIRYTAPEERSVLEVHRNYKLALQNAGFEIVYECGNDAKCRNVNDFDTPLGYDNVFGRGSNRNYSLARFAGSEGDVVVGVFTARRHDKTRTLLLIVEEKPMETGKVEVEIDAETMAEHIDKKEINDLPDDVEGSQDHPMISRFEGSVIKDYEQFNYDRQEFVTGMEEGEVEKTVFEGKTTRISYTAPEKRSVLEVHRNYKLALQDAGFEIVYECGNDAKCRNVNDFDTPLGYDNVFGRGSNRNYSLARLAGSEGNVVVGVFTARRHDKTRTLLLIVEEKPMETGKVDVEIDAESMAEEIDEKGSVRIYGIHFDTDKATIKEESESTLAEIAAFLEENSDLRLGVVGHTDAVGSIEYNMDLSRQRAEAVVEFLASEHGISKDRLNPRGIGPWAPVASNEDEDGRAQNRRVELVKMLEQ